MSRLKILVYGCFWQKMEIDTRSRRGTASLFGVTNLPWINHAYCNPTRHGYKVCPETKNLITSLHPLCKIHVRGAQHQGNKHATCQEWFRPPLLTHRLGEARGQACTATGFLAIMCIDYWRIARSEPQYVLYVCHYYVCDCNWLLAS